MHLIAAVCMANPTGMSFHQSLLPTIGESMCLFIVPQDEVHHLKILEAILGEEPGKNSVLSEKGFDFEAMEKMNKDRHFGKDKRMPWMLFKSQNRDRRMPWMSFEPKNEDKRMPWMSFEPKNEDKRMPWMSFESKNEDKRMPWMTFEPKDEDKRMPWMSFEPKHKEKRMPWLSLIREENQMPGMSFRDGEDKRVPWFSFKKKPEDKRMPWMAFGEEWEQSKPGVPKVVYKQSALSEIVKNGIENKPYQGKWNSDPRLNLMKRPFGSGSHHWGSKA